MPFPPSFPPQLTLPEPDYRPPFAQHLQAHIVRSRDCDRRDRRGRLAATCHAPRHDPRAAQRPGHAAGRRLAADRPRPVQPLRRRPARGAATPRRLAHRADPGSERRRRRLLRRSLGGDPPPRAPVVGAPVEVVLAGPRWIARSSGQVYNCVPLLARTGSPARCTHGGSELSGGHGRSTHGGGEEMRISRASSGTVRQALPAGLR